MKTKFTYYINSYGFPHELYKVYPDGTFVYTVLGGDLQGKWFTTLDTIKWIKDLQCPEISEEQAFLLLL